MPMTKSSLSADCRVLIVGQGLAGTVLSHYLSVHQIDHVVMDNNHYASSTKAAAGLINPITGRGYVKSWMIEDLIAEADVCYQALSDKLGVELVTRSVVLRCLRSAAHINKWDSSTSREGYERFLKDNLEHYDYDSIIEKPMRYGVIDNAYQVDIAKMIVLYRDLLHKEGRLIESKFDFNLLELNDSGCNYAGQEYDLIIFCEGYQAINNPYFATLPFQPAKGEALEIQIENFSSGQILRDEIFLVPLASSNSFWSGGSYIWDFEDHKPTEAWKQEWQAKLDSLLNCQYSIVSHKAGIRPSVKGRRPLIGVHQDHSQLYIFNGMGTKGTSLSPYWARHLVEDHLINSMPISQEVDINRFEY